MQSGISASKELISDFNSLLSTTDQFGLLVTIASEALTPKAFLTPVSPSASFADNLSVLAPHLQPKEALYIILRRYDTAPKFVVVTYVPDAAPVRQKMLFAATRLTLQRELGSEHFRETIFATTPAELTPAGFEKHDAHAMMDAPLTEEEQSLGAVKKAEMEAGQGSGKKEIHLSKSLAMPVEEAALAAMKEVGEEGGRSLVMLKINPDAESVELVRDTSTASSIADLSQIISDTEPRFTFYRYVHDHNGSENSPVLFFYTCPATPGNRAIKSRMLYPLMKRAVLEVAAKECGLTPDKRFEVEGTDEITEELVTNELHPKVQARQAFSRPKRPGR